MTVPVAQFVIEVSSAHFPDTQTGEEAEFQRHTSFAMNLYMATVQAIPG
jgi:hypothetical protein